MPNLLIKQTVLKLLILALAFCLANQAFSESTIDEDELLDFYPTDAAFDEKAQVWRVPIHIHAYEIERAGIRLYLTELALRWSYGLEVSEGNRDVFESRVRGLYRDNERAENVTAYLCGQAYALVPTAANGQSVTEIELSIEQVSDCEKDNRLTISATAKDQREFTGEVRLLSSEGFSVISDLDDTIKDSNVQNKRALLESTLLQPFKPIEGMSGAYQSLSAMGVQFHLVSSSPWQLYGDISQFLTEFNYPWMSLNLKSFRFRDPSLANLLKPSTKTKPEQIESVLSRFPSRKFLLVGDSGEHDPEIYLDMMRKYPDAVVGFAIHDVGNIPVGGKRRQALLSGVDSSKILIFKDAKLLETFVRQQFM